MLAVTGVVAPPLGLALVPVLYAIGALAAPPNRNQLKLGSGLDPDDVGKSLKALRNLVRHRVTPAVSVRVENICKLIEETLPRATQLGQNSDEMQILVKTATDYLPGTLQPYLSLPRTYAEKQVIIEGQTAAQILCSQLDVMTTEMKSVRDAVLKADSDRLLANGRFLEEKFGQHGLQLPMSDDPK